MTTGIAVLGSTGSIGTQTLDVIASLPERFDVVALAARSNVDLLTQQVHTWRPKLIVSSHREIAGRTSLPTPEGLIEAATHPDVDIVVVATSGHDAIPAVIAAIEAGKTIALANKETIVCAGELIMPFARKHGVDIRPVDSEHSAIWQSLRSGSPGELRRILLTASGGPFRTWSQEQLQAVTPQQALTHPNWSMGGKITIDSSTLMNKGLEVIEARWLFDTDYDAIQVLIHPTQIVHSMVEFRDGSTIAQLSPPDMKLPIQYALTWPDRVEGPCEFLDIESLTQLQFELPDTTRFPALNLAYQAGRAGDTYPTVLSAADDVAVEAFGQGTIAWTQIPEVIDQVLQLHAPMQVTELDVVLEADHWARSYTRQRIQSRI